MVAQHLAAAQFPALITSVYWWHGEITRTDEWLLFMMTPAERFDELAAVPSCPSSLPPTTSRTRGHRSPHARLHDLRHIHATTLLMAGTPVHVVAARLGHAAPAITLRVYAHVIHEQAATAADIFAQAVASC